MAAPSFIPSASTLVCSSAASCGAAADPLHGLRQTRSRPAVAFTLDVFSHVLPQVDAEAAELIASYDVT